MFCPTCHECLPEADALWHHLYYRLYQLCCSHYTISSDSVSYVGLLCLSWRKKCAYYNIRKMPKCSYLLHCSSLAKYCTGCANKKQYLRKNSIYLIVTDIFLLNVLFLRRSMQTIYAANFVTIFG